MSNEKTVSKEDFALLQTIKAISKETKQRVRLQTIKINELKIKAIKREIVFKKAQLKKKESLEKHEAFIDGKKPLFMLKSDIEKIEFEINDLEEVNKSTQEEYDNDS